MDDRFNIEVVATNGYAHYQIYDSLSGHTIHCDLDELDETIQELLVS